MNGNDECNISLLNAYSFILMGDQRRAKASERERERANDEAEERTWKKPKMGTNPN